MEKDNQEETIASAPTAQEVAETILAWAKQHKLLSQGGIEDAIEGDEFDSSIMAQQMFSSSAVEDILRRRTINLVLYNEPERRVIIFTNGKINKTETKLLPFTSKTGVQIDYVVGGVAQVKDSINHSDRSTPYIVHKSKLGFNFEVQLPEAC